MKKTKVKLNASENDITSVHKELELICNHKQLEKLSIQLIDLYRQKKLLVIQEAYRSVYAQEFHGIFDDSPGKAFLSLIKTLHPDRLQNYLHRIEKFIQSGDFENLINLKKLLNIKFIDRSYQFQNHRDLDDDIDYDSSKWEYDLYSDFDDYKETEYKDDYEEETEVHDENEACNFIEALMREEPGLRTEVMSESLLSSIEGRLDLSGYGIEDLSGVEFCSNLNELNLENNSIQILDKLAHLSNLRALYLSNNNIENIEDLANLVNIEELDLSFNFITDFSPLLNLPNLKLLNIIGCNVKSDQIEEFNKRNITVIN